LEEPDKAFLEIEIADTGCGISKNYQDQIFEPYFTTKSNGNGMGLALARKIVSDHSGTISVVSRKNFATVFRIMLPIGNIDGVNDA
jgi:nitrogen-specific signal transduction histidine kinase